MLLDAAIDAATAVLTILVTTVCIYWAQPVGGIISSLPVLPLRFGRFGIMYERIVIDTLHLSFLFKASGFVVSASGILVPLLAAQQLAPFLLEERGVLWGVFAAALIATLKIMQDVHLMVVPDFYGQLPTVLRLLKLRPGDIDERAMMRLARAHFMDLVVINLFIVVECYGVVAFCAARLGLFGIAFEGLATPFDGVAGAFTFLRFVIGDPLRLPGAWGLAITGFYGISLLLYTVFFISLSSKLIDEKPQPPATPADEDEIRIERAIAAIAEAAAREAEAARPPPETEEERPGPL